MKIDNGSFSIAAHSQNHYMDEFYDEIMNRYKLTDGDRKRTPHSSNHPTFPYPYNLSMFQISPTMDNVPINTGPELDKQESRFQFTLLLLLLFSF